MLRVCKIRDLSTLFSVEPCDLIFYENQVDGETYIYNGRTKTPLRVDGSGIRVEKLPTNVEAFRDELIGRVYQLWGNSYGSYIKGHWYKLAKDNNKYYYKQVSATIDTVASLPDAYHRKDNCIYTLSTKETYNLLDRWKLKDEVIEQGYAISSEGVYQNDNLLYTWEQVNTNWGTIKNTVIVQDDVLGLITRYKIGDDQYICYGEPIINHPTIRETFYYNTVLNDWVQLVDSNWGVSNANKILGTDDQGKVTPITRTTIFNQSTASDTWNITHNLRCFPSVTVVDSAGNEVVGDIKYIDNNSLRLTFNGVFSGIAYLN